MLCEVECESIIPVPAKDLETCQVAPESMIVASLLSHILRVKALEGCGYFLSVTKLKSIGTRKPQNGSTCILYPVTFRCRTFLPLRGEIMVGVVWGICSTGAFLKCGPMNLIYLPSVKMPDYVFVPGENPIFLHNDHSRIEKDVAIRFKVLAVTWKMDQWGEFRILATLEGNSLGPISLAGSDGLEV